MTDARQLLDTYAGTHWMERPRGSLAVRGHRLDRLAPKAFDALRAALDEHKPFQKFPDEPVACGGCTFDAEDRELHVAYPCATVRAITTALEAK